MNSNYILLCLLYSAIFFAQYSDYNHEIRAQSEPRLHREYGLMMMIQERLSVLAVLRLRAKRLPLLNLFLILY